MYDFITSQFGFSVALMLVLLGIIMTAVAYCILLERKIAAWVQDRIGPNRVGPRGLLQPLADGGKFLLKEDIVLPQVDRPIFVLAPFVAFLVATIGFAVIPWGGTLQFANGNTVLVQVASLDVGLLYILAVGAMSVYGVVLGGWASNNKLSFYGGMRATAQMLSYEIPLGLGILVAVLTSGQLRLENIVAGQIATAWNGLLHPFALLLMLVGVMAEGSRLPFDLSEAEQELVGGYQTEYSSMKMAMFYLGEYAHLITACAFVTVLFLGGWELFPFSDRLAALHWLNHSPSWGAMLLRVGIVFGKVAGLIVLIMLLRWTLPRFRYDQLMRLAWVGMVPAGLALLAWAGFLVYIGRPASVWAPAGEIVICAAALVWAALRRSAVTGIQESRRAAMSQRVEDAAEMLTRAQ